MAKFIVKMDVADNYNSVEFDNKEDAIKHCDFMYGYLTARERAKANYYVLESANPDEESINHFDGNIVWKAYDIDKIVDKALYLLSEYFSGKEAPTGFEVECQVNDTLSNLMEFTDNKTLDRVTDLVVDKWYKIN